MTTMDPDFTNGVGMVLGSIGAILLFKAIMSVKATESEIIKVLKYVDGYPKWFAFTASTKLISRKTSEQTFFMETDYPWPYSNEGMNYTMKFMKIKNNQQKA